MGSDRERRRSGKRGIAAVAGALLTMVGCSSDPEPERATVTPTGAYSAIVRWELERNEPVIDDDGDVEAPVIYLAAGSGGTVDVRVQADVVSDIDDAAVIRFVDDAREARDDTLDGEPVKDDGVMIMLDEFEADRASIEARIVRYRSIDDDDAWLLELSATNDGAVVESATITTE